MISMIAHRMIQNKEIAREAAQEVWYELCKVSVALKAIRGDFYMDIHHRSSHLLADMQHVKSR